MSDPISTLTTGALIGGFAGKFAEKAWDSAENWIKRRFSEHSKQAQEQAKLNTAIFIERLAERVSELESIQHSPPNKALNTSLNSPQFSILLQQTILNSAQTSDEGKSDLLACLIAQRLHINDENTVALASQLASDAIVRSTNRQLKIMAACVLIDELTPKYPFEKVDDFVRWTTLQFRTFKDLQFSEFDAKHLVAIGCASYDPTSGKSLELFLHLKCGQLIEIFDESLFNKISELDSIRHAWTEGLAGVQLTSVGSIVGGLVLNQLKGIKLEFPKWD